ncbi:DUF4426 domain-containing protein [Alteromonadaceae bacterium M269]|nr:DUF4426 domain-containing protein [Alteromonadaceae bacterium M269]
MSFRLHKSNRSIKVLSTFWVLAMAFFAFPSLAEQKQTLGEWDVHYIVVNSTFFEPEVARQYGIQRSQFNALVNISVLDKETQKAQSVAITGQATNLIGNSKKLTFKEVKEGDAIYYLAQIPFRHKENYRFDIDVRHGNSSENLKFKHEFYVD